MPESWRNILEKAAVNLSIDLRQTSDGHSHRDKSYTRPSSVAESRALLARELHAMGAASRAPRQAPASQSRALVRVPVQTPRPAPARARRGQPKRKPAKTGGNGFYREFAAPALSATIVGLTFYAIYSLLH
jgi:hypothetical protein